MYSLLGLSCKRYTVVCSSHPKVEKFVAKLKLTVMGHSCLAPCWCRCLWNAPWRWNLVPRVDVLYTEFSDNQMVARWEKVCSWDYAWWGFGNGGVLDWRSWLLRNLCSRMGNKGSLEKLVGLVVLHSNEKNARRRYFLYSRLDFSIWVFLFGGCGRKG